MTMYYLNNICCICFIDQRDLKHLSDLNSDEKSYYDKLISTIPEMSFKEMDNQRMICKRCCTSIEDLYEFREKCLKSKSVFIDYVTQLNSVSNVIGEVKVRITDIREELDNYIKVEEDDFKDEDKKLENQLKTENEEQNFTFPFVNVTEIKTEIIEIPTTQKLDETEAKKPADYVETECQPYEAGTSQESIPDDYSEWSNYTTNTDTAPKNFQNWDEEQEYQIRLKSYKFRLSAGQFQCDLCDKVFNHWAYLKRHRATHSGERPFHCDICNKSFKDKSNLNNHQKTHVEKPYSCTVCKKEFYTSSHLMRHATIHTGQKLFSCHLCERGFTSKQGLEKHIRLHTGDRPFVCEVCRKAFNSTSHLTVHMRVHTGEKPYSCEMCDKRFTDKSNLNRHIMRHQ